jgi:NTE family protein
MAQHHQELLARLLPRVLGELAPEALALLQSHLEWTELAAGQTLMTQGEPGDAMYLLLSGRLRVFARDCP